MAPGSGAHGERDRVARGPGRGSEVLSVGVGEVQVAQATSSSPESTGSQKRSLPSSTSGAGSGDRDAPPPRTPEAIGRNAHASVRKPAGPTCRVRILGTLASVQVGHRVHVESVAVHDRDVELEVVVGELLQLQN